MPQYPVVSSPEIWSGAHLSRLWQGSGCQLQRACRAHEVIRRPYHQHSAVVDALSEQIEALTSLGDLLRYQVWHQLRPILAAPSMIEASSSHCLIMSACQLL